MIIIFGGTTEGRLAVDVCENAGKPYYYSTKSSAQDVEMHNGVRLTGALSADEIVAFCKEKDVKCIIDAAHPFAVNLHQEIAATKMPVIRLQRSFGKHIDGVVYCSSYEDAVAKMSAENIHCLLALSGANTIGKLSGYWNHHKTIFRILQRPESIETALKNGFPTTNLLFYNDDYTLPTKDEEKELMKQIGCDAIITKESGESGGFFTKVEAAIELGLKVFVIEHPQLPSDWIYVNGKHGLRRAIEHTAPDFFPLKTGFTTGACATAAAKAALLSLLYDEPSEEISFALPDGEIMTVPVCIEDKGIASVIKDFSDDPDVTKGCKIIVKAEKGTRGIRFLRGRGVGIVTLPGLGIPVGEPAINSTPRRMIEDEIRNISNEDFDVTISVENGEEIAKKTFNEKVGVMNGISIIGTSGIVSPLSNEAFIQSIKREIEVAAAIKCDEIALVSGKKGEDAVKRGNDDYNHDHNYDFSNQKTASTKKTLRCIHYGNFIGEALKAAYELRIPSVTVAIMIGKAVKLAEGHLDTHSHKVQMNKEFLKSLAPEYADKIDNIKLARELWSIMPSDFFETIRKKCYEHCRTVYPQGELKIRLICDDQA